MRGSMECKNASKESLSESVDVIKELDVSGALADKLAVCVVSVSSSYIMESAGVKRKDGAAKRSPPVASFLPLESLLVVAVHTFLAGARHCVMVPVLVLLTAVDVAERIMFIVDFIVYIRYIVNNYV
jgi:hypothetical protein